MDVILAKVVLSGTVGFLVGGCMEGFRLVDGYVTRHQAPWQVEKATLAESAATDWSDVLAKMPPAGDSRLRTAWRAAAAWLLEPPPVPRTLFRPPLTSPERLQRMPVVAQAALLASREGWRTASVIGISFGVMGVTNFLLSRGMLYDSEALFNVNRSPNVAAVALACGVYAFTEHNARVSRLLPATVAFFAGRYLFSHYNFGGGRTGVATEAAAREAGGTGSSRSGGAAGAVAAPARVPAAVQEHLR